jgi:tetratricopeptide (TPR) repeat protein
MREGGGYMGAGDELVDIQIADSPDPVGELSRIYSLWEPVFLFPVYIDADRQPEQSYAMAIMERSLALEEPDVETLNSFAWTLAERGLYPERALDLAMRAHLAAPDDANIMDTLAQAFYSAGMYDQAVTWESEALRREPESVFFQEQLKKFEMALEGTERSLLEPQY